MYISPLIIAGLIQLAAVEPVNPKEELWAMTIEVCRLLEPEIEAAIKKKVILPPKRDCRWFAITEDDPLGRSILVAWPTEEQCQKAVIPLGDLFFERNRRCQQLPTSSGA